MLSRRAWPEIIYEGTDITEYISEDLLEFSYTDNASGTADDISITLKDTDKKWLSNWAPDTGDRIDVVIKAINWRFEGDNRKIKCGSFLIDEPEHSSPPTTVTMNGISIPSNTDFTTTPKSNTWFNATIREIAQTIAGVAGLELVYEAPEEINISFEEQSDTPDMEFLYDICSRYGLGMKVYSNKIIIFDEYEYEKKAIVETINENNVSRWKIKSSITNSGYDGCSIVYFDPHTGSKLEYKYIIPGSTAEKIYKINEEVYSYIDAEARTISKLRELNKNSVSITLELPANLSLVATNTVKLNGFGKYNGKYYIDKMQLFSKPCRNTLDLHRVLEGY